MIYVDVFLEHLHQWAGVISQPDIVHPSDQFRTEVNKPFVAERVSVATLFGHDAINGPTWPSSNVWFGVDMMTQHIPKASFRSEFTYTSFSAEMYRDVLQVWWVPICPNAKLCIQKPGPAAALGIWASNAQGRRPQDGDDAPRDAREEPDAGWKQPFAEVSWIFLASEDAQFTCSDVHVMVKDGW